MDGIRGITLKIDLNNIEVSGNKIKVESGVLLSKLANIALENELSGLEFSCGIPGTVGGAVRMNAGAYGNEVKDVLEETTYIDENLEIHTISNVENEFKYRSSRFVNNKKDIILSAVFALEKKEKELIKAKMEDYKNSRFEKQPIEFPSAGSSFKRKDEFITAKAIDELGLKGYHIGDAYISTKHAGFIINKGNAKAEDVLALAKIIREKVYEKYNVEIDLEFEVLGED